jgi:hypothetical protein
MICRCFYVNYTKYPNCSSFQLTEINIVTPSNSFGPNRDAGDLFITEGDVVVGEHPVVAPVEASDSPTVTQV